MNGGGEAGVHCWFLKETVGRRRKTSKRGVVRGGFAEVNERPPSALVIVDRVVFPVEGQCYRISSDCPRCFMKLCCWFTIKR